MQERISGWSLWRRLGLIAFLAMLASIAFGGLAMYWAATIEEDQMLDARLETLGATVLSFVEEELNETDPEGALKYHNLKTRPTAALLYRYQVWSRDGALLLRSHEAPADAPLMPLSRLGFATVHYMGEQYRSFGLPTKDRRFVIQVAENIEERWTQTSLITMYYMGFLLIPIVLVFGMTWFFLRRSLGSIDAMAEQLSHRNPLDLAPLLVPSPPRELLPVLRSVDALFARVGRALSAERNFTAIAAHEMRTPLAGLRAHAQLASAAHTESELQDALRALRLGVDRAAHLIDQLLDLARVEGLPAAQHFEIVALSDLCQSVMIDLGPKARGRQISFGARFQVEQLECHAFAMHVLLRNLIANAILYSPEGGRVELHAVAAGDAVALMVDDSGSGIHLADREQAFERFNRLGRTRADGVGLGLAIVLSVVELHHAKIELLDSPLGGLRVRVLFGAAAMHDPAGAVPPAAG
jgi:signal transduction histidine kinase